jgi:hypothetical protein
MFTPEIILQFRGGEAALMIVIFLVAIAVALIPFIFFALTVSRTMKLIAPHNRRMSPGGGWLLLIPLFQLVWQFLFVSHIADSVAAEYRRRGLQLKEDRPLYQLGLWSCILSFSGIIPVIGVLGALASLVMRIIYWVKLAEIKAELERSGPWEQFAHIDAQYAQNWNQASGQNWNQPQQNWNQPQQQNWNQPPATPPQQNWTPPANTQNPPPPPTNTGGIDLNKRD